MSQIAAKLDQAEALLVRGQIKEARSLVLRLAKEGRPRRSELARLAELLRRCGLSQAALKCLNRVVRPNPRFPLKASDEENLTYASVLINMGAVDEGEELLTKIDSAQHAKVHLYRAYADICRWDYDAAIHKLQAYVAAPSLDAYAQVHGKVNLLACYVHELRHAEAADLAAELAALEGREGLERMRANFIRLMAMHYFEVGDFSRAAAELERGRAELKGVAGPEEIWFSKWDFFIRAFRSVDPVYQSQCFDQVRKIAHEQQAWEILRDCDLQEALLQKDQDLFLKVYTGTPYPKFRERILRKLDDREREIMLARGSYVWRLGPADPNAEVVNLMNLGVDVIHPSRRFHRFLLTLASDFYHPHSLLAIHRHVYTGEHFNPSSTPAKIYQLIHDYRVFLREQGSPLEVREDKAFYRLDASMPVALRVPIELRREFERGDEAFAWVAKLPAGRSFDVHEAERLLELKSRSCRRTLHDACEQGLIQKTGTGKGTRYRLRVPRAA